MGQVGVEGADHQGHRLEQDEAVDLDPAPQRDIERDVGAERMRGQPNRLIEIPDGALDRLGHVLGRYLAGGVEPIGAVVG